MPLDLEPIRARLGKTESHFWENDCKDLDDATPADRDFINHAPHDIDALLEEVERLRTELAKVEQRFIVRLEPDCWLAAWKGDPGRTCVRESAKRFRTAAAAWSALKKARQFRPFTAAAVERVP